MKARGALNYIEFRAAPNPTWFGAEGVGVEPTDRLRDHSLANYSFSRSGYPPTP